MKVKKILSYLSFVQSILKSKTNFDYQLLSERNLENATFSTTCVHFNLLFNQIVCSNLLCSLLNGGFFIYTNNIFNVSHSNYYLIKYDQRKFDAFGLECVIILNVF